MLVRASPEASDEERCARAAESVGDALTEGADAGEGAGTTGGGAAGAGGNGVTCSWSVDALWRRKGTAARRNASRASKAAPGCCDSARSWRVMRPARAVLTWSMHGDCPSCSLMSLLLRYPARSQTALWHRRTRRITRHVAQRDDQVRACAVGALPCDASRGEMEVAPLALPQRRTTEEEVLSGLQPPRHSPQRTVRRSPLRAAFGASRRRFPRSRRGSPCRKHRGIAHTYI